MDWDRAIEINHAALTRIVAGLIAMMELANGGRMSKLLHRAIARVLFPAESAVRRLIVIAARGIKVKPSPSRPMPKGLVIAGTGGGRISFQLFDTGKRFDRVSQWNVARAVPRIHNFASSPLVPLFQPRPVEGAAAQLEITVDAAGLGRRLAAVRIALENLPRQANRMARWQARRDRMQSPKFRSPFRPGPPPGHRKKPTDEVDWVLKECHALASDALNEDTS